MSRTSNRDTAHHGRGSVEHRLARLLDTPFLARVVPHLPPEALQQIIRSQGLDACGELVTSATPAQLTSLLDLDLWRDAQPGRDEQFDVDRFGEWIEVLVENGDSVAARTVAALDTSLVVAGLSCYVRVFDPGIFEPTAESDDEPIDFHEAMREGDSTHDRSGDTLTCEVGGYVVRGRRSNAWDAIVTLLLALDGEYPDCFHAVMQGCRQLSNSRPEVDGLDDLLMAPEQHLHDVAIERERRRSRQGYATPADARAFLQMARQPRQARGGAAATASRNPIATGYFRAAEEDAETRSRGTADAALPQEPTVVSMHADEDVSSSIEAVIELLAEAGLTPERPRALLETADADPEAAGLTRLRRLMKHVGNMDAAAYFARSRELAFLANALVAGCSVQSRPFTPREASDAAARICNLGLEYWPARWPSVTSQDASSARAHDTAAVAALHAFPPDSFLIDHDLVTAFEVGWSVLHRDVSLFVAQQLISTLDGLHCVDRDIRRGLAALRRALVEQRDAGTPWLARGAADALAMLDVTAWAGVVGLLDECPVLPAALTAILEGRTTTVSPTAFDFISTAAQVGDVRIFMRKLGDLLSR